MLMAGRQMAPEAEHLFLLLWGAVVFSACSAPALNLRDAADRMAAFRRDQYRLAGREPRNPDTFLLRAATSVLALAGAGCALAGAAGVFDVDTGVLFTRQHDLGAAAPAVLAAGPLVLWSLWLPRRSPLRTAWATRRGAARALAVLFSLTLLGTATALALGRSTLAAFAAALTGVAALLVLLSLPRRIPVT
ncbi:MULTISPECIES: hypothetical protein [Kitasatospora]|uniref:Uncharacterized protein n=1 Tax=Kitasatospora setae (strain ATCC 33774 / DSM 43861 / JCM 3304 / KCC A-0304 / NBRC 14216 / KM-6054) TaxID=452652 RepID=E4N3G3_KITSK|nr:MULTISPECIES: hypothetical protein [Kitasatospora]BAJ32697.1 hypothetical protein KSE_69390 [Kitasatospora setae KM-6054]